MNPSEAGKLGTIAAANTIVVRKQERIDTYKSKNKGQGRAKRRQRYQDGKSY